MPTFDLSWLIPFAIALPNLLWTFRPPVDTPPSVVTRGWLRASELLERIGQVGCFVVPFFCRWQSDAALLPVLMAMSLGVYYLGWIRYFARGRPFALLFAPLAGVPIPLALSPVAFLLASAGAVRSVVLLAFALVFAAGHIPMSWQMWRRLRSGTAGGNP